MRREVRKKKKRRRKKRRREKRKKRERIAFTQLKIANSVGGISSFAIYRTTVLFFREQ